MEFVSVYTNESSIHKAQEIFPEQFAENTDRIMMETDLYLGIYDAETPKYELRCSASASELEKNYEETGMGGMPLCDFDAPVFSKADAFALHEGRTPRNPRQK